MESTPNLNLPYIMPSQAQKHVTHNDAIRALDVLVGLTVEDMGRREPPAAVAEGQGFIVSQNATGIWANKDDMLAFWQDGSWSYHQPKAGWRAYSKAAGVELVYGDSGWIPKEDGPSQTYFERLGVNAIESDSHHLTLRSSSTLFDNDGDDHRLFINKASLPDTASIVFQNAFSGHAELGLNGNNDLSVRVSADGQTFRDALVVNYDTGVVSMPFTPDVINTASPLGARAVMAGAQNLPDRSYSTISGWSFVENDMADASLQDGMVTFGPESEGRYVFSATVVLRSTDASIALRLKRGTSDVFGLAQSNGSGSLFASVSLTATVKIFAGDTVSMDVWHDHGSGVAVHASSVFSFVRLG